MAAPHGSWCFYNCNNCQKPFCAVIATLPHLSFRRFLRRHGDCPRRVYQKPKSGEGKSNPRYNRLFVKLLLLLVVLELGRRECLRALPLRYYKTPRSESNLKAAGEMRPPKFPATIIPPYGTWTLASGTGRKGHIGHKGRRSRATARVFIVAPATWPFSRL